MVILVFDPELCIPRSQAAHRFDSIELKPGLNSISISDLEVLRGHPDYSRYKEWGAVSILSE